MEFFIKGKARAFNPSVIDKGTLLLFHSLLLSKLISFLYAPQAAAFVRTKQNG